VHNDSESADQQNKSVDQPKLNKDKFDAYVQLANYWANSYQGRRDVEWKVGLALWAVILTAIINKDKLPTVPCPAVWLTIVWLIYVVVWLIPILVKNWRDKHLSHEHLKEGTNLISVYEEHRWLRVLDPYSLLFHALTTGLLLLALNYSLTHK
jgi:hypothetical protein